jgi:hypothetical protein
MTLPPVQFQAPKPGPHVVLPHQRAGDNTYLGVDLSQPHLRHGDTITTLELITPEIAKRWRTQHNPRNRTLDPARSAGMSRDQAEGNWYFIGDAIRFATWQGEQIMIDGQHRCSAIEKSGEPQWYLVVRGLPLEALEAIDTGKVRTFAHTLAMEVDEAGQRVWHDENNLGAITRMLMMWERNVVTGMRMEGSGGSSGGSITKAELRTYLEAHKEEILDAIKVQRAVKSAATPINISSSKVAAAWVLLARKDRAGADLFVVDYLARGLNITDQNSPQAALRRRLTRTDVYRPTHGEGFLLILKAWNHWRRGDQITKLQAPRDGWPRPEDFGIL